MHVMPGRLCVPSDLHVCIPIVKQFIAVDLGMVRNRSLTKRCVSCNSLHNLAGALVGKLGPGTHASAPTAPGARPQRPINTCIHVIRSLVLPRPTQHLQVPLPEHWCSVPIATPSRCPSFTPQRPIPNNTCVGRSIQPTGCAVAERSAAAPIARPSGAFATARTEQSSSTS